MKAVRVAAVVALWTLRWMADIVLVLLQLAGAFVAAIGATRLYYAATGTGVSDVSIAADKAIAPDQAIFYVGAIVLGLATWARWELKK